MVTLARAVTPNVRARPSRHILMLKCPAVEHAQGSEAFCNSRETVISQPPDARAEALATTESARGSDAVRL